MNTAITVGADWMAQYRALVERSGLVDLGRRTQIELRGPDRATFLHNLCTNEIRKLQSRAGCEAFLTSVQGKTLAHVFIFAGPDSLVIDTVPGQSETILAHLNHYLVCEQVELVDRTQEWSELLLAGPTCQELLYGLTDVRLAETRCANDHGQVAGENAWLRRADLVGPVGFLVSGRDEDLAAVRDALCNAGAMVCGSQAFEAARVEWGFPLFGPDITDRNLPQEVARDSRAISFVKGCYLGQETVARIDALGHVNKTLVGIRFHGNAIGQSPALLDAAGQSVGETTSLVFSPHLGSALALGYVRRGSNAPGTRLTSAAGDAEVVAPGVR